MVNCYYIYGGSSVLHLWLNFITFMVGRLLHLWSNVIAFMVGITFMVVITFMGDTVCACQLKNRGMDVAKDRLSNLRTNRNWVNYQW